MMSLRPLWWALALCVVVALWPRPMTHAQTATATPTATPTVGTPTPALLPNVTPILYATPTVIGGCPPPISAQVGDAGYIRAGVWVRHQPTLSGALVYYVAENINVTIVEGPVCADGFNWWRVTGTDNPGWVVEGRADIGYFLFSYGARPVGCAPLYQNAVGKSAELLLNTRVRASADPNALVKTVAPAGAIVAIVGGPQCVDGYLWWQVEVTVADFLYNGWMAEGGDGVYWLVPQDAPSLADGTLCADPRGFVQGQRAIVRYRSGPPKTLRAAPGEDAQALFSLVRGVPLVILDGPVCANNLNWWKVRVLASTEVIGWLAEGSPGVGYWIAALEDVYPLGPGR